MSYVLKTTAKGYYTSLDAKNKRNSNSTVPPGTYEVYNRYNGVVNITRNKNYPGWWINESESPSTPPNVSNSGASNSAGISSTSQNNTTGDNIPYTGNNTSTVYEKNPHYIHPLKDDSVIMYISNLVSGTTMEMDVSPTSFSESNKSNFDGQEIRGRSSVIHGYNSTGPRTVSMSFTLYDDYCYYGLKNTINFINGLMFPSYAAGFVTPPQAYVKYGNMISMRCFITADVTYDGPLREGMQISAAINLTLTEIRNDSMSVHQVEQGGQYI